MTSSERDALAAIALFAALADGGVSPPEQARLQAAIQSFSNGGGEVNSQVYQRVMLGQTTAGAEAGRLTTPEIRRQAYELAVSICAADGATSVAEQAFLAALASSLGLNGQQASGVLTQADQIAGAPFPGSPLPAGPGEGPSDSEIDQMITSAAITTGALELLPHSLASMAIIPIQMRLVYRIGSRYGYALDRGSIGEFLGVLGFGATSQMVESVASKLLGGLFGGAGGLIGAVTGTAGGAAVSFASTYALGKVAHQYYAGGRKLAAIDLKSVYSSNMEAARGLFNGYAPQVQAQARGFNPAQLLTLARGGLGV